MLRLAPWVVAALLASPASADDKAAPMGKTADEAFARSIDGMMKGMDVKPTGNADKDFVLMMPPHRQGAADMAKAELQYGKDPALLKLATGIVAAQQQEIALMKAWLARNSK